MPQKSVKNALANYVKKLGRRVAALEAKMKTGKKTPRDMEDEEPDDNEPDDNEPDDNEPDDEDGGEDETENWP